MAGGNRYNDMPRELWQLTAAQSNKQWCLFDAKACDEDYSVFDFAVSPEAIGPNARQQRQMAS